MRLTLAFLAGLLAGFLLAWTSGSALDRLAGQWRAAVPLQAFLGVRAALMPPADDLARAGSPQASLSFYLRRPLTRLVRMASSRPSSTVAIPAAGAYAAESVASSANATAAMTVAALGVDLVSNATGISLPEASEPIASEPQAKDSDSGTGLAVGGTAREESRPATAIRPNLGEKNRRSPQKQYDLALGSYQSAQYELARERFAAFLKEWPRHRLAPNALYWSGETWYARGRYDRASEFFARVVRDYPSHAKSPDALLKLAYSAMRQGRLDQAGSHLRELADRYPGSPASRLGRQAQSRLQGKSGAAAVSLVHG